MNLFIDTNILLSFYHYTNEDLEELNKLVVLLNNKKIKLLLSEQVIQEFNRNRETKLADALKRFEEEKLNSQFPQVCKHYDQYSQLQGTIEAYKKTKSTLINSLRQDILSESLKADLIIKELFKKAQIISLSSEIWENAKKRHELRNPPGKNDSCGDAINWETLLTSIEDGEDLYFISEDGDYLSKIDPNLLSPFLVNEWKTKKKSEILFFRKLSSYFKEKFPNITLASELEKDVLVRALLHSGGFATTHFYIEKLSTYSEFTKEQLDTLLLAGSINTQVSWILNDDDVRAFYEEIVKNFSNQVTPDILDNFLSIFNSKKVVAVNSEDDVL